MAKHLLATFENPYPKVVRTGKLKSRTFPNSIVPKSAMVYVEGYDTRNSHVAKQFHEPWGLESGIKCLLEVVIGIWVRW